MTDFSNHTNDQVAQAIMEPLIEAEARAAALPDTPEAIDLRRHLAKMHLHGSFAVAASNGGGYTSFNGGDKTPPGGP